jgi:cytochrome b involved in lipid metabolism
VSIDQKLNIIMATKRRTNEPIQKRTLEEVKSHDSASSCWMVIHGKVYDVTDFQDDHPGSSDVLLQNGGAEASRAFDSVGHSDSAKRQLDEFYIGDLASAGATSVKSSAAATPSSTESTAAAGPSIVKYLVPLAAVGFAVYVRFFAPKA